jgi:hypothetical protein
MDMIPTIFDKVIPRPDGVKTKKKYFIPDPEYGEFWENFYHHLGKHHTFQFPVPEVEQNINPYFGYFGYRFHPFLHTAQSFHIGVDISSSPSTPVLPIADGVLEYSGYGVVNGNYVLLSHPHVVTEDGFMLYSVYMHMKETKVGFSRYEKMLREISLHSYPVINLSDDTVIGLVGDTGNPEGKQTHLYMQCELRDTKGRVVAIDPARILGISCHENLTKPLESFGALMDMYETDKDKIIEYGIEKYFETHDDSSL